MASPTPRSTRLLRAPDLRASREALIDVATAGAPLDARDRVVIVPTHASAALLVRGIEERTIEAGGALAQILPDMVVPRELVLCLAGRLAGDRGVVPAAEREVLLGVACRSAHGRGHEPPFRLRPGLVAEMLRLYDDLRRRGNDVDQFERRTLGLLEPGAATDRGAERLARQTRFLVAAFRDFESRVAARGDDEHALRARLIAEPSAHPYRHAIVTVADEAFDPYGLDASDWDLLSRLPGLERLDVLVTDTMLAGALHERMHRVLPGIEEVRVDAREPGRLPVLVIPPGGGSVHVSRDREEEVASCARRIKAAVREGVLDTPAGAAVVVRQRLPYVYLAREVLRSAGIPCQTFDALPLAAEPYAAALDLILVCASTDFARLPAVALLGSPHFRFATPGDVAALDRLLAEAGYLGGVDALERLLELWRQSQAGGAARERAGRAGTTLLSVARELATLRSSAPAPDHLDVLIAFLTTHEVLPAADSPLRPRHLRARGAILTLLGRLRDAYAAIDREPMAGDEVAALVRRWIEGQTFAPRTGESGVHLVDADSARFGRFDEVYLAGVVDSEWPEPSRRSIFYSAGVLRELGWPEEADRLSGARAAFADLLRLPASRLHVSTFALESDVLVGPSPLLDEVEHAGFESVEQEMPTRRIFRDEALWHEPPDLAPLGDRARPWVARRRRRASLPRQRYQGFTDPPVPRPYSLSALERYQECPFKFFAAEILRLEEEPEDESIRSPRARGRFIHQVFEHFFKAWDARGGGPITPDRLGEARALMVDVADPLLSTLSEADAAIERARLFGSAISTGSVDIVLGHEISAPAPVTERLLEYRLEGEFSLGGAARRVALRGVADRIDLLGDRRLRVVDYKSGSAPNPSRALQVAIYALCAQERLEERDGRPWRIDEATYLSFTGKRSQVSVVKPGSDDGEEALASARQRVYDVLDGVAAGRFPPQPHDPIICDFCAYASVCRKDYVHD